MSSETHEESVFVSFVSDQDPQPDQWYNYHYENKDFKIDEWFLIPFTKAEFLAIQAAHDIEGNKEFHTARTTSSGVEREYADYKIPWGHSLKKRKETLSGVKGTTLVGIRGTKRKVDELLASSEPMSNNTRQVFSGISIHLAPFIPTLPQ